jgi:acyl-coenzyme A synthetase/AMP-(fatty) acid ligase
MAKLPKAVLAGVVPVVAVGAVAAAAAAAPAGLYGPRALTAQYAPAGRAPGMAVPGSAGTQAAAPTAGTLRAGSLLRPGKALHSPGRAYALVMQPGGSLAVYRVHDRRRAHKALWSSRTHSRGAFAAYQGDGNFVIYSRARQVLWATGTRAGPASFLSVQNDGNVVIYSAPNGSALWATGTAS